MNEGWFRRRWWEFRQGHSVYLIFVLTFVNFILIAYRLLIEKIAYFKEIFPEPLDFCSFVYLYLLTCGNFDRILAQENTVKN